MDNIIRKGVVLIICLLSVTMSSTAQNNSTWSSMQINKKIDSHWSIFLKPIVRQNLSDTKYLNWSPDYAVNYTFSKNWRAMLLGRTWFMPNRDNRQFIFADIKHQHKFSKVTVRNTLRYHHAYDIGDFTDPDFVRWHPTVSLNNLNIIEPFLGTQVFYRVNGVNKIQRVRYVLGLALRASPDYSIGMTYWNEVSYNTDLNGRVNIWVLNLSYKL